jgi:hypothetical protein
MDISDSFEASVHDAMTPEERQLFEAYRTMRERVVDRVMEKAKLREKAPVSKVEASQITPRETFLRELLARVRANRR